MKSECFDCGLRISELDVKNIAKLESYSHSFSSSCSTPTRILIHKFALFDYEHEDEDDDEHASGKTDIQNAQRATRNPEP